MDDAKQATLCDCGPRPLQHQLDRDYPRLGACCSFLFWSRENTERGLQELQQTRDFLSSPVPSSNPADLHPLFLEDQTFCWNIIWFYRSVYEALLESCGEKVVRNVFGNLKQYRSNKIAKANLPCGPLPFSAMAALTESVVGEMRFFCRNESYPQLDHAERFKKCNGCRIRHYCTRPCQTQRWTSCEICKTLERISFQKKNLADENLTQTEDDIFEELSPDQKKSSQSVMESVDISWWQGTLFI